MNLIIEVKIVTSPGRGVFLEKTLETMNHPRVTVYWPAGELAERRPQYQQDGMYVAALRDIPFTGGALVCDDDIIFRPGWQSLLGRELEPAKITTLYVPAGGRSETVYGRGLFLGSQAIWWPGTLATLFADWLEVNSRATDAQFPQTSSPSSVDALLAVWLAINNIPMARLSRDITNHQSHPNRMPGNRPPHCSDTFQEEYK